MSEKITTEHTPGSLNSEIKKAVEGSESFDVYSRYGYPELEKREKEFSEITKTPDTALFNSGMAAICTAVESEKLKPGEVVLCGKDVYLQTKEVYEELRNRGVKIELIDSGDMDEIEEKIGSKNPRLIILESIANSQDMQVCDIGKLVKLAEDANNRYQQELSQDKILDKYISLNKKRSEKIDENFREKISERISEFKNGGNPFVFREVIRGFEEELGISRGEAIREVSKMVKNVIGNSREKLSLIVDNTLASPVLYNPIEDLGESDIEMVVVESGTKHYQKGQDEITMGIAYSNKEDKIKELKEERSIQGSYLQPSAEDRIPQDIVENMKNIVKQHAKNALRLAEALSELDGVTEVYHPNLPQHKNSELAKKMAPYGLVTLFYAKVNDPSEFVKKVKEVGGDDIGVGVSFGHKRTWIFNVFDELRIAAGHESNEDFEKVIEIFKKALEK